MNKTNSVAQSGDLVALQAMPASEEIITLLAHAPNILEFKPSEQAKNRVWELVTREKAGALTTEERTELEHYAQVEHIMRLVKAQARQLQQTP